jgi:hypothetical protein
MDTEPFDLIRHFHEMSDEELIRRCGSDTLIEIAQSIAIKELKSRALHMPEPVCTAHESAKEEYEGDFETVARFLNPTDAHLLRACLDAAGVPAVIADANLVQTNSLWAIAIGGARVLVRAARVADAKEIIEAFGRGDLALPDDGDSYCEQT